jgi:hypothetical protein
MRLKYNGLTLELEGHNIHAMRAAMTNKAMTRTSGRIARHFFEPLPGLVRGASVFTKGKSLFARNPPRRRFDPSRQA